MSNETKHFPQGFFFKESHPNAPDFVKGGISIKVDEFKDYLSKVNGEWLNLDLKVSKGGKPYAEVNTFKPDASKAQPKKAVVLDASFDELSDGLPF